ncbi:DUF1987 domain-containing protein [Microscilla marina]|uniref:SiaC family regulatory phosphoprotein domain-containing protein n=1 Tax=Microscilla marina ATCC 23134 TaxID=313606 RepID=A1ZNN7_MICM2|nr:DUF1987 domain-containing protein [Microscilla marina]EAY27926.1 conserved hypothetical protein [Microscilla marina ATCC 23134]
MSNQPNPELTPPNIIIKGSKKFDITPSVNFNGQTGICKISGESHHQNDRDFYLPLVQWIRNYAKTGRPLEFNFKFIYFSTASSKQILLLIEALKQYEQAGGVVTVNWYYPEDDEEILEEAEDYIHATNLKMNLISY